MYKSVNIDDVEKYMLEMFVKYGEEVVDISKKCTDKLAPRIKPEIKGYSQKGGQLYKTGVYKTGWGVKTVKKKGIYQIKTYNRKKPTLVHLLEFGHRPNARSFPHVRKTELKYLGLLMDDMEREINKI